MAKIVKIFLIAAFSCVLAFGASSEAFFAKFDKDFIVATPNYKRSLHKELKSLYQGASHKEVRIKALKRLVYSSKNLGLDSSAYEKELARLNKSASAANEAKPKSGKQSKERRDASNSKEKQSLKNSKAANSTRGDGTAASSSRDKSSAKNNKSSKTTNSKNPSNSTEKSAKSAANPDKNDKVAASKTSADKASSTKASAAKKVRAAASADLSSLSKEDLEFLRSTRPSGADTAQDMDEISSDRQSSEDASAKNEEDEPSEKNRELRKSSVKKEDKSANLALNSLRGDASEIVLEFNRDLQQSDYKDFTIASSDNFRFVIDFAARQKSQSTRLKDSFVGEVRISQYDDKTVRVVLSDENEFNAGVQIDGNLMILSAAAKSSRAKTPTKRRSKNASEQSDAHTAGDAQGAKSASVKTEKIYKSTKGKLIVIDPGHGGSDSGAIGNGLKEKSVVLATSKKLGALLQKRGYKVLYTRTTDVFINLRSRTAFAARKNADMFISIHANAAPNAKAALKMNGVETFFLSPARSERSKNAAALENKGDLEDMNTFSKQTFLNFLNREKIISSNKLAIDIQSYMLSSVKKSFASKDGGVREAPFWVLVGATMPAVLVEIGYITHPQEGKNLGKSAYQDRIAQGIANGVDAYFQKNK